ncbi:hypothetical protein ATO2_02160 [Roseovarius sp. 22II1-1F6A]|nr:hypothetical protein ATO2_02160 [Roseovarius sp. 22II1-1F6A]
MTKRDDQTGQGAPAADPEQADTVLARRGPDGSYWVEVPATAARAHPKGRPGALIWASALWLAVTAGIELWLIGLGFGGTWAVVFAVLSLLAAAGLMLRVPLSLWLTMVICVRQLWRLLSLVGGGAVLLQSGFGPVQALILVQAALALAVGFYLLDGDRPNLIYRRRYRATVPEEDSASEATPAAATDSERR